MILITLFYFLSLSYYLYKIQIKDSNWGVYIQSSDNNTIFYNSIQNCSNYTILRDISSDSNNIYFNNITNDDEVSPQGIPFSTIFSRCGIK